MGVTIKDIADRAGVSKTTVSRVLNRKPDVDEQTKNKIQEIIKETGYSPSLMAKNLATGKTNFLGLLVPTLTHPWIMEVTQGIAEGIEDSEYELALFTTSNRNKNQELIEKAINSGLTDGLIVLLSSDNKDFLSQIHNRQFPIILIGDRFLSNDIACVTAANKNGSYLATRHLVELGHRRIGFVEGPPEFLCSRERLEGYKMALNDSGMQFDEHMVKYGDLLEESGFKAIAAWAESGNLPSAVFLSSDEMASGALRACKEAGLEVPENISIVGFDDIPKAAFIDPPLTTVRQPMRAMGKTGVEILINQIVRKDREPVRIELETDLIVRNSSGPIKS
jgi:LacI family transcriptional regulator